MRAFLIVEIEVTDPDGFKEYVAKVPPLVAKHGGSYLVRGGATEVLEGDWRPERLVVLQFPDADAARSFVDDPEYAPIKAIRLRAARNNMVLVDGVD